MTRDEAITAGHLYSYGYASDDWLKKLKSEVGERPTQYDVEMFFFLNYEKFPTPLPRAEHWWYAAGMRWPTVIDEDGRAIGKLVRHKWAEAVIEATCTHSIINLLGGAGQGKTTTPMAFGITIWDYFVRTESGARFQFSTVNEGKLEGASWAACAELYSASVKCSSNVATGVILPGSHLIKRNRKDGTGKGIIRGVLVPNDARQMRAIEALTGAHVPTAQILAIDESQDSSDALDKAAYNLRMHARYFWMFRMANPKAKDGYEGRSGKPAKGDWDDYDPTKVTDPLVIWETNYDGQRGIVLRFDNEQSPGMDDPVKYWFLPTKAKLDRDYPTEASRQTAEYFRFGRAWFVPEFAEDSAIKWSIIEEMGCHQFPNSIDRKKSPINFMSLDTAPASLDRSPLLQCQLLYDGRKQVLNFASVYFLRKVNPEVYYQMALEQILEKAREWNVPSGHLTIDNTAQTGLPEMLRQRGFSTHSIIYHNKASEKRIEPQATQRACDFIGNLITEGALLLEAYIRYGQIRGLNDTLCANIKDELCSRRLVTSGSSGKVVLEPKNFRVNAQGNQRGFRDRMGFSPDIMDTMCQAAIFARDRLGFIPNVDRSPQPSYDNRIIPPAQFFTRTFINHR